MPGKLQQVLSRADTPALMKWIGKEAGELVHLLDSRLESPSKLSELLLGLRGEAGLLDDSVSRNDLLDFLREPEAQQLLQCVHGSGATNADPFAALRAVDFRRPAA